MNLWGLYIDIFMCVCVYICQSTQKMWFSCIPCLYPADTVTETHFGAFLLSWGWQWGQPWVGSRWLWRTEPWVPPSPREPRLCSRGWRQERGLSPTNTELCSPTNSSHLLERRCQPALWSWSHHRTELQEQKAWHLGESSSREFNINSLYKRKHIQKQNHLPNK